MFRALRCNLRMLDADYPATIDDDQENQAVDQALRCLGACDQACWTQTHV